MAAWMLFGICKDPSNEFFIVEIDQLICSNWDKFEMNPKMIPYFLDADKAMAILTIGKSSSILNSVRSAMSEMKSIEVRFSPLFSNLHSAPQFDKSELLDIISTLGKTIGSLLFQSVTSGNQIADQLIAFREIYLGGHGLFLEELIDEEKALKKKMSYALLPLNRGDLNCILKKTLKSTAQNHNWYTKIGSKFKFIDLNETQNQNYSKLLFGSQFELEYAITWPLNLIVGNLQSYFFIKLGIMFCFTSSQ